MAAGLGATASRLLGAETGVRKPDALSMVATLAPALVWPGLPTTLMTYGGTYPSPTLRVRRGDLFDLRFENLLPEATNIHWHGLSVPAMMDGHPMDVVAPGGFQQYTFDVQERAGTYWYHPHPDARTAAQVWGGMAGFFIVEDDDERALGLPSGAQDVPLMLQDRLLSSDGSFRYAPEPMELMEGYLGDVALVNGVPDAQLTVAAAPYRFRLLNGSNARIFRVAFEDSRTFHVIGGDGGLLEQPLPATEVFLSPAERVEIFVDLSPSNGQTVRMVSLPFTGGGLLVGGTPQGTALPLLRLTVQGSGPTSVLPPRLARLPPLGRPEIVRRFVMEMRFPPIPGNFWINGRSFDPDRVDTVVDRGVTELWEVANESAHPHPFHVHATQFRVLGRSRGPVRPHEMGLKDTVLVWPGESVKIAISFERYAGVYVLHCHNLEHEDAGMMSNFEVR